MSNVNHNKTVDLLSALDAAYTVLRMVGTHDQTERTLDVVALVERTAIDAEHLLPEFCPAELPMRVGGGAKS